MKMVLIFKEAGDTPSDVLQKTNYNCEQKPKPQDAPSAASDYHSLKRQAEHLRLPLQTCLQHMRVEEVVA
jgi:hypothetical protein